MMRCVRFDKTENYEKTPYGEHSKVLKSCNYHFNNWMQENPDVNIQFIHTGFDNNGYPVSILVYYLVNE